jgi:hypothetical protein
MLYLDVLGYPKYTTLCEYSIAPMNIHRYIHVHVPTPKTCTRYKMTDLLFGSVTATTNLNPWYPTEAMELLRREIILLHFRPGESLWVN